MSRTFYIGATIEEMPETGMMARLLNRVSATNENARALTTGALYNQILSVENDMRSVGFPNTTVLTYAVAQMMHESDWMTSNVANTDNNYSGIKWLNKQYQKNATKGIESPEGGAYAHFDSFRDWATDFLRILSLDTGKQGRPIDATSAQEYLDRLKANHYFTDPGYYSAFNAALKKVNEAVNWGASQDQQFLDQQSKGVTTFTYAPDKGGLQKNNNAFNFDRFKTNGLDNLHKAQDWAEKNPAEAIGAAVVMLLAIHELRS